MLTSGSRYYVDIRILTEVWEKICEKRRNHEENPDPIDAPRPVLEWAFCGTSQMIPATTERGIEKPEHCTWHHWVDSKTTAPDPDEGDMWPQKNGDVLERGFMKHPETGDRIEYEELWGDLDALAIKDPWMDVAVRRCIVLKHESDEAKGLAIRVGQYIHGVMRSLDGFCLMKYEWHVTPGKECGVGTWRSELSLGYGYLPIRRIIEGIDIKVGEYLDHEGARWELVEDTTW